MEEKVGDFPVNGIIAIAIGILLVLAVVGIAVIALYIYDTFFRKEEEE